MLNKKTIYQVLSSRFIFFTFFLLLAEQSNLHHAPQHHVGMAGTSTKKIYHQKWLTSQPRVMLSVKKAVFPATLHFLKHNYCAWLTALGTLGRCPSEMTIVLCWRPTSPPTAMAVGGDVGQVPLLEVVGRLLVGGEVGAAPREKT